MTIAAASPSVGVITATTSPTTPHTTTSKTTTLLSPALVNAALSPSGAENENNKLITPVFQKVQVEIHTPSNTDLDKSLSEGGVLSIHKKHQKSKTDEATSEIIALHDDSSLPDITIDNYTDHHRCIEDLRLIKVNLKRDIYIYNCRQKYVRDGKMSQEEFFKHVDDANFNEAFSKPDLALRSIKGIDGGREGSDGEIEVLGHSSKNKKPQEVTKASISRMY